MAQITFETDDSPKVLRAIGNLITEITGDEKAPAKPESEVTGLTVTGTDDYDGDFLVFTENEVAGSAGNVASTSTATQGADGVQGATDAKTEVDDRVDTKGVPFNGNICGQAKIPFYATGKRQGQWKKRQGVQDATYDEWYVGTLKSVLAQSAATTETTDDTPIDTSGAFGSQQQGAGGDGSMFNGQQVDPNAPTDAGSLMGWVSNAQAAGKLTQDQIRSAYEKLGLEVTSLFPPNPPEVIATNVTAIYTELSNAMGAA